jgi:hypothetical protein
MDLPGILIEINPRWLFVGFDATRQLNGEVCKILFWKFIRQQNNLDGALFAAVPEGPCDRSTFVGSMTSTGTRRDAAIVEASPF